MVFMYGFLVLLKIYADYSVNEMLVPANGLKVYGVFTTLNQFIVSISCINLPCHFYYAENDIIWSVHVCVISSFQFLLFSLKWSPALELI